MPDLTYKLTNAEFAEALSVAMTASFRARFVRGLPDEAAEIGVRAGIRKGQEIARRRLGLGELSPHPITSLSEYATYRARRSA